MALGYDSDITAPRLLMTLKMLCCRLLSVEAFVHHVCNGCWFLVPRRVGGACYKRCTFTLHSFSSWYISVVSMALVSISDNGIGHANKVIVHQAWFVSGWVTFGLCRPDIHSLVGTVLATTAEEMPRPAGILTIS